MRGGEVGKIKGKKVGNVMENKMKECRKSKDI